MISSLSSLLKTVLETLDGRSLENIFTSIQQRLEAAFGSSTGANVHTTQEHGGGRTAHLDFQVEELEDVSIRFLSAHSKATNWKQIVSLQNDFGQTMAHIAVMLGYPRLLGSLIGWGIDLNLTDLHGSTALHYAFLCNESACAILLIRSGADELTLDELGRSAWDLNPPLADECTSRLQDVPKVDGSFSVSYRPAEESEMEHAEAAALEATYVLVQRWLELMEGEGRDTNDLNGEHMPQFGISPPCLPSNLGDRNGKKLFTLSNHLLIERLLLFTFSDLTVENTHIDATRPNQSAGMVPKVHPLSDNLHPDSQSINSPPPQYSECDKQWVKVSVAPSQPGTSSDVKNTTDPLDSRHEPPHTCGSSTSTRVMAAPISVPSPVCDNSFATEEGGGIDGVDELKLSIPLEHIPSPTALQSLPVTTPEYATSYEQEPEEPETFHESKRHSRQVIQSTSSQQQAMSKSASHPQNAGCDRGGLGEYGGLIQKPFNRSRFSHRISLVYLFTNRLRLYSDSQAPWPSSHSVSSPEMHQSGSRGRLLRKDITGQDGGSLLSYSPLVRPAPLPRITLPWMVAAAAANTAVELAVPHRCGSSLGMSIIPSPHPILTAGGPENQGAARHRGQL